ncbi:hypothetical protein P43SY_011400 [Pythium insidiosum]|uniref:Endonuclease/exonuclease/phosphatase domain-containing protein n=1 Tax=Pythium insidiosum TaxID=114742 RepID=A0AAD5LS24_PYTIN|nr:hypothetical protein P43SY_011400 [Pythium insidiosum]
MPCFSAAAGQPPKPANHQMNDTPHVQPAEPQQAEEAGPGLRQDAVVNEAIHDSDLAPKQRPELGHALARDTPLDKILDALQLHTAPTPANGNCQFHALVEGILQRPIQTIPAHAAEKLTTLIKQQISSAASIDGDAEFEECGGRLGADTDIMSVPGESEESIRARRWSAHKQYFVDLASSPSDVHAWLPNRLWGGMDTLRLAAKALGRSVYVLARAQTTGFYQFRPGRLRPDVEAQRGPLLLVYEPGHYNALLPTVPTSHIDANVRKQLSISEFVRTLKVRDDDEDGTTSGCTDIHVSDYPIDSAQEPINLSQVSGTPSSAGRSRLPASELPDSQTLELVQALDAEVARRRELIAFNSRNLPYIPQRFAAELDRARHNVRGFGKTTADKRKWMRGWKRKMGTSEVAAVFLQETHVGSDAEQTKLRSAWRSLWGLDPGDHPTTEWSFWTTHSNATGGVALLLNPFCAAPPAPHDPVAWTERRMAVRTGAWLLVNVYAPSGSGTAKSERETFFGELNAWLPDGEDMILGGDFNAVITPSMDRVTANVPSEKPNESPSLLKCVTEHGLVDALEVSAASERRLAGPDYCQQDFTHWTKEGGARLDRFYVSVDLQGRVADVQVHPAHRPSDHHGVLLFWSTAHHAREPNPRRSGYPFKGTDREREAERFALHLQQLPLGGYDGLNNDFFLDHAELLVPYLVPQFQAVQMGAPLPPSAAKAIILPLPKGGDASNPMNYRPISLLTTYYKNPAAEGVVLLLDIYKAYDTINRDFLWSAWATSDP